MSGDTEREKRGKKPNKLHPVLFCSIFAISLWIVYGCFLSWKTVSSSRVTEIVKPRENHGAIRQIPWLKDQVAVYSIHERKCCEQCLISTFPKHKWFPDLSLQSDQRASSVNREYDPCSYQELFQAAAPALSGPRQILISISQ